MASKLKRALALAARCLLAFAPAAVVAEEADAGQKAPRPGELPQVSGFSGYLFFGAGYRRVESNLIPGTSLVTVGNPVIDSVDQKPDTGAGYYPAVTGELNYTLAPQRLQFFFGSNIQNVVTLDYAQLLGVRREFKQAGTLAIAYTFSGIPAKVWEDPYLEGVPRQETDRKSAGYRLEWTNIFQTGVRLQLTRRQIDIGEERSGFSQLPPPAGAGRITAQQPELLDRNGTDTDANVHALLPLTTNYRHLLIPELGYADKRREGSAISHDRWYGKLSYAYRGNPVTFVVSGEYGISRYDKANPVYDKKQDGNSLLLSSTLFYQLPTRGRHWSIVGNFNYAEDDSDVPFLETRVLSAALGVEFRL